MTRIEPKHVAANNNVKYTTNPNNDYSLSCVRLSTLIRYLTTQWRCLT